MDDKADLQSLVAKIVSAALAVNEFGDLPTPSSANTGDLIRTHVSRPPASSSSSNVGQSRLEGLIAKGRAYEVLVARSQAVMAAPTELLKWSAASPDKDEARRPAEPRSLSSRIELEDKERPGSLMRKGSLSRRASVGLHLLPPNARPGAVVRHLRPQPRRPTHTHPPRPATPSPRHHATTTAPTRPPPRLHPSPSTPHLPQRPTSNFTPAIPSHFPAKPSTLPTPPPITDEARMDRFLSITTEELLRRRVIEQREAAEERKRQQ